MGGAAVPPGALGAMMVISSGQLCRRGVLGVLVFERTISVEKA